MNTPKPYSILFVCLGNICRSPAAEIIFKAMVKEQGLGGVQLHNGGDREFMTAFGIRGIPRFILLDKEGKIVNPNMTRPSNPETEKTLKALKGI